MLLSKDVLLPFPLRHDLQRGIEQDEAPGCLGRMVGTLSISLPIINRWVSAMS